MLRRTLALALVVLTNTGCPSSTPPPQPPAPTPPPSPPKTAPVVQRFATGIAARGFDDARRAERVRSVIGEVDTMLREAQGEPREGYPGLIAGVVIDDQLVWSRGYGQRTPAGGAVTSDTVFRIGSITKTFTGMAALRLRDAGKLALDAAAHDYLRPLGGVRYVSADDRPLTLRQLLTHTSGLPRNAMVHLAEGEKLTEPQLLASFDGALQQSPTLDVQRYSNLGVGTAGLVVATVAGKPYRTLVDETILEPLGMTSTYWEAVDVPPDRLATGHGRGNSPRTNDEHLWLGPVEAAGAIYSTLDDMARYASLHLSAWPPRSDPDPHASILRRASLRESHTMQSFNRMRARLDDDGKLKASAIGTGIAWQVEQTCAIDHLVWHNGATAGYTAALFMAPRRGIAVILMANSKRGVTGLAYRMIGKLIADAELTPRSARPSRALQSIVDGVVTEGFGTGALDEKSFAAAFADDFRTAVPYAKLSELQHNIHAQSGACRFARYLEVPSPHEAWLELQCDKGEPLALWVRLALTEPQRISGYLVRPLSLYQKEDPPARCTLPAPDLDN